MASSAGHSGAGQPPERAAESALNAGDFAEAERQLTALAEQLKVRSADRKRYARTLTLLASAQWKQDKSAEAKANASAARPLLAETKQYAELSECLGVLGSIALDEENAREAADLFREAVDELERVRPQNPLTQSNMLRRWAEALRRHRDFEAAKTAASRALNLVQDRYGKDDVNTGECLLELGRCEREGGDPSAAIQTLKRALDIFQQDRGRDSEHEVLTLQQLAEACQEAGDLEQAVGFYEKTLKERERQLGGKAEDAVALLTNMGAVLSLLGRYGPAIELLQQAVVRLEGSRDARLGSALDLLGNTYFQFGRFEDAVECVRKARGIWESMPAVSGQVLEANQSLLSEIANYLPYQRRVALGLATPAQETESPTTARRKKSKNPWDSPEPTRDSEQPVNVPRQPAQPHPSLTREPATTPEMTGPLPGGMPFPSGVPGGVDPRSGVFLASAPPAGFYPPPPGFVVGPETAGPGYPAQLGLGWLAPGAPVSGYDPQPVPPGAHLGPGVPGVTGIPGIPGDSGGLTVSFERPDGTLVEPAAGGGPVHLRIVLGEGGIPAPAATIVEAPGAPPPEPVGLNGWDDLGFDFLPQTGSKAA